MIKNTTKNREVLSDDFVNRIAGWAAGYVVPNIFNQFISLLESEAKRHYFSRTAESNLIRILTASYDKSIVINDTVKYPHYAEILILISVNSNYLTDILVRNPEYFFWITTPSTLKVKLTENYLITDIENVLSAYKNFSTKVNALRNFKRKEILRIGLKDLTGTAELKEITEELSLLAKTISSVLFELCYKEVLNKYEIENIKRQYCLAALGKLGGNELNYSSDIDLILFFDKNTKIKNKEYFEILVEAAYLFIEQATAITGYGFLYRVDFRLRPDGRNSPLARTAASYISYYESRGEDWERQMLIKTSFVAGSKFLYNKFFNYLTHFIYPSSFLISPVEQIKKMKANIERKLKREDNIKLIAGGIRDIEFSVQALQLLNGGKNKNLRTGNTLTAIDKLFETGLLSQDEKLIFKEAYLLYRNIEHYLQLMNDTQTHTIPAEGELFEKLSNYLGFKNSSAFSNEVNERRKKVQLIFSSITGSESDSVKVPNIFESIDFFEKTKALSNIDFLREGKGIFEQKTFDKQTLNAFSKIEPHIAGYLRNSLNPDLVLQNFVRVIRPAGIPSVWYSQFSDRTLLNAFLNLCEHSQKTIDLFAEDEELRDYFLTKKVFEKLTFKNIKTIGVKKLLFILSVQFSIGKITAEEVSTYLKKNIEHQISSVCGDFLIENNFTFKFFLAAMGSLGAGEMNFNSDIDLIFIAEKLNLQTNAEKDVQNLLGVLKEKLKPFAVDCRLRPEGKNSRLLWDLISCEKYFSTRARIWELQTLTKLSFLTGDKKSFNSFVSIIKSRIKKENCGLVKKEIIEMRNKLVPQKLFLAANSFNIKKNRGGLADIEFLIQYLILCNAGLYNKCLAKGSIKSIREIIFQKPELSEIEKLIDTFRFLKMIELLNQNIFNSQSSVLPVSEEKLRVLAARLNFKNYNELMNEIELTSDFNREMFDKYLIKDARG